MPAEAGHSHPLVTDAAGAETKRSTFLAYGDKGLESAVSGHREEKGYIGENADAETGLIYLHARYYDPAIGYISPVEFERKVGLA